LCVCNGGSFALRNKFSQSGDSFCALHSTWTQTHLEFQYCAINSRNLFNLCHSDKVRVLYKQKIICVRII
jgi:hypothetical protein